MAHLDSNLVTGLTASTFYSQFKIEVLSTIQVIAHDCLVHSHFTMHKKPHSTSTFIILSDPAVCGPQCLPIPHLTCLQTHQASAPACSSIHLERFSPYSHYLHGILHHFFQISAQMMSPCKDLPFPAPLCTDIPFPVVCIFIEHLSLPGTFMCLHVCVYVLRTGLKGSPN